jgi:hypothetical protein
MRLDLSPRAAELAQAQADTEGVPLWQVFERLVMAGLGGEDIPHRPPKLPPLALEMAQEAAAFLAHHEGQRKAPQFLRKAWKQACVLASHELGRAGNLDEK